MEKEFFRVIGLMSGTSMDGLDMVDVTFFLSKEKKWSFCLNHFTLYEYSPEMQKHLKLAFQVPSADLIKLSADLGCFYAEKVNQFLSENSTNKDQIDCVSSHGQTIFHQPKMGYTLQIGNGPELAVNTQIPTVTDFRTKDIALGGNGAPLIPVADYLLFYDYADSFLNLGGFGNLSFKDNGVVKSFDVCPVNIILNYLVEKTGVYFDKKGDLGREGQINRTLLQQLNDFAFYKEKAPKSLGWEWVLNEMIPLLIIEESIKNKLRTLYEHIAFQIGNTINNTQSNTVLITGGGTKNDFLIERIKHFSSKKIIIPDDSIIDFKEAIGFAFLGLLKWREEINVWASVTGAIRDSSSGVIFYP